MCGAVGSARMIGDQTEMVCKTCDYHLADIIQLDTTMASTTDPPMMVLKSVWDRLDEDGQDRLSITSWVRGETVGAPSGIMVIPDELLDHVEFESPAPSPLPGRFTVGLLIVSVSAVVACILVLAL